MFTGIIEETGEIKALTATAGASGRIEISGALVLEGTRIGDSIAVSGVCLTVVELSDRAFKVDVMPETMRLTTLGGLEAGSRVNLERALGAGGRLGGHLVNGHIDGVGTVRDRRSRENAVILEIGVPGELATYVVPKGSIALDGISLTVVDVADGSFRVSVIPHTLGRTTLGDARPGTRLNVEVDIIAKYVEAFLSRRESGGLEGALRRNDYM